MSRTCPACATENPDAARFCMACGGSLEGAAPPREERRLVSILFADLVGFTERSDRADPEDVRRTLIPFHRAAKEAIEAHGGVLDKFIGDAAMGVFGAPVAHEDDPVRAVRAARALLAHVDELRATGDPAVAVRVAVNTGEAVVAFGSGPQIGEAVAGDVVNTASRMQSLAPRDGLVVGDLTREAIRDVFDTEPMDPVEVKGKAEPLRCWRVTGARTAPRADAGPMVGRGNALAHLRDALAAAASGPRIVTVVAEPGMGKTRLLTEFRSMCETDGVRWLGAAFAPYGQDAPFAPLARLVRAFADPVVDEDPGRGSEVEVIVAGIDAAPDERRWLAARLGPLFGDAGAEGAFEDAADTAMAVGRIVRAFVAGPTVCAIEDIHSADPWVRDVVLRGVASSAPAPALFLITSRPEGPAEADPEAWGTYVLPPLGEEDTALLMRSVLTVGDDTNLAHVAARAGGNPLFALEFARGVRDAVDVSATNVPTSVRAVIGARLDALPSDARTTVLDAAVVGVTFWPDAVAAIGGVPLPEVDTVLADLLRRTIVERRPEGRLEGHEAYGFTHALFQEEAYGRLARADRARKHLEAARWLEHVAGEDAASFAGMLAHHLGEAVETARAAGDAAALQEARPPAIRWMLAAADEVFRLDTPRAFRLFSAALDLEPDGEDEERALYGSGIAGRRIGALDGAEVLARYERALAGARGRGDPVAVGQMLTRIGSQAGGLGDSERAVACYDEAIALLESLPPGRALAAALAYRAEEDMLAGHPEASLSLVERSLPIAEAAAAEDMVIMGLHLRGDARASLGDMGGLDDLDEALAIARRIAGVSEIVTSLNYVADWRWQVEGCAAALAPFEEAAVLARERGAVSQGRWADMHLALVLTETGTWDRVLEIVEGLLGASTGLDASVEAVAKVTRSLICLRRGLPDQGFEPADILRVAEGSSELQALVPSLAFAADAAAAAGDRDEALARIRALDAATKGSLATYRAGEAPAMVRIALALGAADLARAYLAPLDADLPTLRDRLFRDAASAFVVEAEEGPAAALDAFHDVRQRWNVYGHAWEELAASRGSARAAVAAGRADAAAEARARAEAIASALGVPAQG